MIEIEQLFLDIQIKLLESQNRVNNIYSNPVNTLYSLDFKNRKESIYKKIMALTYNSTNYLEYKITQTQLDLIELVCKCHNVQIASQPVLSITRINKESRQFYTKFYSVEDTIDFNNLYYDIIKNPDDMFHIFTINDTFRYVQVKGEAKEKIPQSYLRYEKLKKLEKFNS